MKKDFYLVSVPRVPGVNRERMRAFIQEAVATWGGQLAPSNPMDICPKCWGDDAEACSLCNGYGAVDSDRECDPLGPPCVLGKPRAVSVKALSQHQVGWIP